MSINKESNAVQKVATLATALQDLSSEAKGRGLGNNPKVAKADEVLETIENTPQVILELDETVDLSRLDLSSFANKKIMIVVFS
jgi:hypothetical protein